MLPAAAVLTSVCFVRVCACVIICRSDLLDIHSVESDPEDACCFYVYMYKSKTKLQLNKMFGAVGLGMNFERFLQKRYQLALFG